jgi:hypothetical protein
MDLPANRLLATAAPDQWLARETYEGFPLHPPIDTTHHHDFQQ